MRLRIGQSTIDYAAIEKMLSNSPVKIWAIDKGQSGVPAFECIAAAAAWMHVLLLIPMKYNTFHSIPFKRVFRLLYIYVLYYW